jgi:hypothetical protein
MMFAHVEEYLTLYDIVLSVTGGRSVVFSGNSGFLEFTATMQLNYC